MIRNRCNDTVDFFIGKQLLVAPRSRQGGTHYFLRKSVAAVIKIARRRALHAGQLDGRCQQARALHADTDDAKTHAITGRDRILRGPHRLWIE